jgi:tRNA threonylcarbamoyladenosine biosynthesis protein TsaB
MNLVALETSTPYLSIAVAKGMEVFERHILANQRHAELALDTLDELLREAALGIGDIHGIAYGEGPGAFTGVRIACGMAQGLALARSLPVVGVGSLIAVAEAAGAGRALVCLDARMSEVYHAAYEKTGGGWREITAPGLCRPEAVPVPPEGDDWLGCGSGFEAYAAVLQSRFANRLAAVKADVEPTARAMLRLARPRFERGEGTDAALAQPIYLRDKVALTTQERLQGTQPPP